MTETQIQDDAARLISHLRRLRHFVHHARIGAELLETLDDCDSLMICVTRFNDEKSGAPYTETNITVLRGAKRITAVRRDLLTGLLAISGKEPRKKCKGPCGLMKILTAFSVDKMRPDGRNRFCLVCERKRVRDATAAKKQKAVVKAAGAVKNPAPSQPVS